MGKPAPGARDLNTAMKEGSFAAPAVSDWVQMTGKFNLSLSGFGTGQIVLQRSFDGGLTPRNFGAAYTGDTEAVIDVPGELVLWRVECTGLTAGPLAYRLSQ